MNIKQRVESLAALGDRLLLSIAAIKSGNSSELDEAIQQACCQNRWFTKDTICQSIDAIAQQFLVMSHLEHWLEGYDINRSHQRIGIIMAGNIPLVGFHDLLCVLITGHTAVVKTSSKDSVLIRKIAQLLIDIDPQWLPFIVWDNHYQLTGIDKLIATGSNNTARYFVAGYQIPLLVRKNRFSVAILYLDMTTDELTKLSIDMLSYFGLGCRSVSNLFVPEGFDFQILVPYLCHIYEKEMKNHISFNNCYQYQKAVLTLSKVRFFDTKVLIVSNQDLGDVPLATIHYQYYSSQQEINDYINRSVSDIQCITDRLGNKSTLRCQLTSPYGSSQLPTLGQYADQIDTINFILN